MTSEGAFLIPSPVPARLIRLVRLVIGVDELTVNLGDVSAGCSEPHSGHS